MYKSFGQLVRDLELTARDVSILSVAARHLDKDLSDLTETLHSNAILVIQAMLGQKYNKSLDVIALAKYLQRWHQTICNQKTKV